MKKYTLKFLFSKIGSILGSNIKIIFIKMLSFMHKASYLKLFLNIIKWSYKIIVFIVTVFSASFFTVSFYFNDLNSVLEYLIDLKDTIVIRLMHWLSIL
jgi:hypothetical protein